ncbi:putative lipid-binding transport protein (Tim44 family) [Paucimonas lemoignei]|uniref:Putative lipid-binding transport protein (Tim44 family) n=1 Tax=Paucimonas lemoignei TaxID=29443 RepID=A0A4R3HNY4_PAULE|nr:Tim44-like domain-containing protein [Paucimonas lemoignei]TCS32754.1 putative lipid-binding transport protein (Tim44 family) [Paucimonas lemoignei]
MKTLLTAMLVGALTLTAGIPDAEAKRMGGGGSFGRQSQSMSRQATPPSQSHNQAAPAQRQAAPANNAQNAAAKPASPWKGMLGGALLGLGLGALLSHLGIGGALASAISSILMIALLAAAAFFIYRMIKRKSGHQEPMRPAYASANSSGFNTPNIGSRLEPAQPVQPAAFSAAPLASGNAADTGVTPFGVPADFDTTGFLRHAKSNFIRLQAAWDRADINDIREFSTPEMFGELRLQLQERGASANHTDVVSLNADLLGIETVGTEYVASVKFDGMIRESEHAAAEPFAEIWNLTKPANGQGGWLLAGIQQVN